MLVVAKRRSREAGIDESLPAVASVGAHAGVGSLCPFIKQTKTIDPESNIQNQGSFSSI